MILFDIINKLAELSVNPQLFKLSLFIIDFTGAILLLAVLYKFVEHHIKHVEISQKKKHFFSTLGMTIVVLVLCKLWILSIGQLNIQDKITQYIYFTIGCIFVICGIIWHIKSKFDIGLFWSDGIEIKENHSIVKTGAYALARHPMYASLLMWTIGATFLTFNWAAFLIILFIFFPLMKIRANDEEKNLIELDSEYLIYKQNVKMLCPTLKGTLAVIVKLITVAMLIYFVIKGITISELMLIFGLHLYLGFCLTPEKVAFSYRSKSGLMVFVWLLSKVFYPAYYFYYVIILMFIYGLKWNCPCMIMYEKFGGCPCLKLFKKKDN